jgi:hypothetical protein
MGRRSVDSAVVGSMVLGVIRLMATTKANLGRDHFWPDVFVLNRSVESEYSSVAAFAKEISVFVIFPYCANRILLQ